MLFAFVATHAGYYVFIGMPGAEGIMIETSKTMLLDGIATLIGVFALGVAASRILNRALEITVAESDKTLSSLIK